MSEANKAIIMRIFEEALNQGNLDLIDELFTFEPFEDSASAPSRVARKKWKGRYRSRKTALN